MLCRAATGQALHGLGGGLNLGQAGQTRRASRQHRRAVRPHGNAAGGDDEGRPPGAHSRPAGDPGLPDAIHHRGGSSCGGGPSQGDHGQRPQPAVEPEPAGQVRCGRLQIEREDIVVHRRQVKVLCRSACFQHHRFDRTVRAAPGRARRGGGDDHDDRRSRRSGVERQVREGAPAAQMDPSMRSIPHAIEAGRHRSARGERHEVDLQRIQSSRRRHRPRGPRAHGAVGGPEQAAHHRRSEWAGAECSPRARRAETPGPGVVPEEKSSAAGGHRIGPPPHLTSGCRGDVRVVEEAGAVDQLEEVGVEIAAVVQDALFLENLQEPFHIRRIRHLRQSRREHGARSRSIAQSNQGLPQSARDPQLQLPVEQMERGDLRADGEGAQQDGKDDGRHGPGSCLPAIIA